MRRPRPVCRRIARSLARRPGPAGRRRVCAVASSLSSLGGPRPATHHAMTSNVVDICANQSLLNVTYGGSGGSRSWSWQPHPPLLSSPLLFLSSLPFPNPSLSFVPLPSCSVIYHSALVQLKWSEVKFAVPVIGRGRRHDWLIDWSLLSTGNKRTCTNCDDKMTK